MYVLYICIYKVDILPTSIIPKTMYISSRRRHDICSCQWRDYAVDIREITWEIGDVSEYMMVVVSRCMMNKDE